MIEAGTLIVKILEKQNVERVFCVPGESYLSVMNGLQDTSIETILCKHEGGASIMAEADGKLTGRPGIAFVTRGPGATNAASGIHIAQQDSTPLIMFVGQVERKMFSRDAFQEVDYQQFFGGMCKMVFEIQDAQRIPEILSRAFHTCLSGRPGPVIITLPEDMLRDEVDEKPIDFVTVSKSGPTNEDLATYIEELKSSKNPIIIVGGSVWSKEAALNLEKVSELTNIPIYTSHRRQSFYNNLHKNYAGDLGLGVNPQVIKNIKESDFITLLGNRLSENPSQAFTLLQIPENKKFIAHIHPGPEEIGKIYKPNLGIVSNPINFIESLKNTIENLSNTDFFKKENNCDNLHKNYLEWGDQNLLSPNSGVDLTRCIRELKSEIDENTIITNGAGNYAVWVHRLFRFTQTQTQLAPISGSMGYGVPAAIAAKLRFKNSNVIAFAGDGCFQMTHNEFATAVQFNAGIVIIVVDNEMYGTIRMHQHKNYQGKYKHTGLKNPDFAKFADAMGGIGITVNKTDEFIDKFKTAKKWSDENNLPSLLHVKTGQEMVLPGKRFDQI